MSQPGPSKLSQIQGLRAIAVTLVLLFHAGLPVKAGFYGVDVFFVISGFVITSSLLRLFASGESRPFLRFYSNRFWRIAPALSLVVAFVAIATAVISSPLGPRQIADLTGLAAMFGVANFAIARTTGGYFDPPAATNPLLHTWSLSVEEQFYVVLPVFLYILIRLSAKFIRPRRIQAIGLGIVAALSFGYAFATNSAPASAALSMFIGFYSPIGRAWELLVGALLALYLADNNPSKRLAKFQYWLGLGLLVCGLLTGSSEIPTPGIHTLLPVVGTALWISGSLFVRNPLNSLVSSKAMVYLGDRSYSIYLWHWPLIVIAEVIWPLSWPARVGAVITAVLVSLLAFRYWGRPIQLQHREGRSNWLRFAGVLVIPLLIAGGSGAHAQFVIRPQILGGQSQTFYSGDLGQDVYHQYVEDTYFPCEPKSLRDHALSYNKILRCQQSKPSTQVDVALIGDSHAEHLFPGLAREYQNLNIVFYIQGSGPFMSNPDMKRILDYVGSDPNIKSVVLAARWVERGMPESQLKITLEQLLKSQKTVWLADDTPSFPSDPFECKYGVGGIGPSVNCSQPAAQILPQRDQFANVRAELKKSFPHLQFLNTFKYFCPKDKCMMTRGSQLLFRDSHHLNLLGSNFLAHQLHLSAPDFLTQ